MSRSSFGNIRRRSSGRYQASYRRNGETFNAPSTFATKREAIDWLTDTASDINRGHWTNPRRAQIPFGVFAERWLASKTGLRDTTRVKYRGLLDRHILKAFAAVSLSEVSPLDVSAWYSAIESEHRATAAGAYRVLRAIFNAAIEEDLVQRSPCRVKGGGAERSLERPTVSQAELAALIPSVAERFRLAVLLAVWCQLRRGEVLGVRVDDLDLNEWSLKVERSLTMVGSTPQVGPPKPVAGRRKVFIPPNIHPEVRSHLGSLGSSAEWLFPRATSTNGDCLPTHPRTLDRAWREARRGIGREDLRFHDLRHTGLTWAASTGATIAELMRQGGHSSPAAAIRYQHATDDRAKVVAERLGALAVATAAETPPTTMVPVRAQESGDKEPQGPTSTNIVPFTRADVPQSQRGSNPCLHLERVVS